jgi:hypothetical protein
VTARKRTAKRRAVHVDLVVTDREGQ